MRGRVLVVDDDALIRQAAERSLTRAGFEVATAATTWQARFLSTTGLFDVAILDYFLEPGERGCDLIPELRARSPAIRIAVVSGLGVLPEVVCDAHAAGADVVTGKIGVNWAALARGERPQPAVPPRPVVDLDALRREAIHGALLVHGRNISDTARALGMTRSSLQRLLRKMPLPVLDGEPDPTEGSE
jgi:ActR/RegA family two-component response regulator